jgi:hypothetical protein
VPRADKRLIRLVAVLAKGITGITQDDRVVAGEFTVGAAEARELVSAGVLILEGSLWRATPDARGWLKRQLLEADALAAQHRIEVTTPEGLRLNLAESPLSRLATSAEGEQPFLARHQVEAGEKVRRLAERAQIQPRVTMSYSAAHVAGGRGLGHAADIGDMAAEARKALTDIHRVLPRDCADVVLDVCGLLKGLQVVESERGWPRRSAKLVLRIGLEQLAQHYGLAAEAVGADTRKRRTWLGEGARPERFE